MHEVFERRLLGQHHFTGSEIESLAEFDVPEARARSIVDQAVTSAKQTLHEFELSEFLTETRVDPGAVIGRSDFWGTADLIAADAKSRTLLVGDLKTGRVRVDVEFNDQLLAYGLGALPLLDFEPERVVLAIYQPPVNGPRAALWQTTPTTLREFAEFARVQAAQTDLSTTQPTPSIEACQWCPARVICPAHVNA